MAELGDGRESNQKLQEEVSSHSTCLFLKTTKFHDNFETLFKENVLSYVLTKSIAQNLNLVNDTFEVQIQVRF